MTHQNAEGDESRVRIPSEEEVRLRKALSADEDPGMRPVDQSAAANAAKEQVVAQEQTANAVPEGWEEKAIQPGNDPGTRPVDQSQNASTPPPDEQPTEGSGQ